MTQDATVQMSSKPTLPKESKEQPNYQDYQIPLKSEAPALEKKILIVRISSSLDA